MKNAKKWILFEAICGVVEVEVVENSWVCWIPSLHVQAYMGLQHIFLLFECHKNLFQCSVLLGIAVICHAQMQSFCSISSQWCDPGLLSSIRLRLFHAILVWNQIIPSVYFLFEIELTLYAHSVLKTVYNQIVHLTTQLINLVLFLASVTTVLTVFVFLVLLFYNYFEWRI